MHKRHHLMMLFGTNLEIKISTMALNKAQQLMPY